MTMSAEEVAEAVGGPTTPFSPERGELSTLFHWFEDKDRLCVIAGDPSMKAQATDVGFAHALGHLGDRDLTVVFPKAGATAVAQRLPFLDIPSASFVLRDTGVERLQPLRASDVIASFKGPRGGSHDVSKARSLIEPLVQWLDDEKALMKDDRQSYRTWQYHGRQVLTLRVGTDGGVQLVAGVNYSNPAPGREPTIVDLRDAPITDAQLQQVKAAIAVARAGKDSGEDIANAEHLLQEKLRANCDLLDLRDAPLREVPVRRPVGNGYIDLVGAGKDGHIRVIETKLGPFDRLVVQGLDYWIWATANAEVVADWLHLPSKAGVEIEYVVAEKTPGYGVIGSYTSGQAEALQGAIRWRFTTVRDWNGTAAPDVCRLPLRVLPMGSKGRPAPRKAAPRWSVRLARHLAERAKSEGVTLGGGVFWPNAVDGLEPAAALIHQQLLADGLAHRMVGHVRSSQAFALNLFAPLDPAGRVRVAAAVGIDAATVSEPRFEWSDPEDHLGERTNASPHATQVDVILDCIGPSGKRTALLIEVKLSEDDFNPCSAWLSSKNDRLDVCGSVGPFGNDPTSCFQLRNHGREHRRRYDEALGSLSAVDSTDDSGCWFRFGGNQAMRNVALARTIVENGQADSAVVALCAPEAHHKIWRRWAEAKQRLLAAGVVLADLRAEDVVGDDEHGIATSQRYLLQRPVTA